MNNNINPDIIKNKKSFIEIMSRGNRNMDDNKNKKNDKGSGLAIGISLGLCIGVAIGIITNNIGLWLPVGLCLGVAFGSAFNASRNGEDAEEYLDKFVIKFNREAVCMGDDVDNKIYQIEMPSSATLGDLMHVVRNGGNGNDWHITSGYEWDIYTNIGKLARISPQTEKVTYYDKNEDIQLSDLGIIWVYVARDIDEVNVDKLEDVFRD